jgi:hypothetical protein
LNIQCCGAYDFVDGCLREVKQPTSKGSKYKFEAVCGTKTKHRTTYLKWHLLLGQRVTRACVDSKKFSQVFVILF